MSSAMCCNRPASMLASSVCGGRSISTVVNRPCLVHIPSPLRPSVSRGFLYSTAAVGDDWIRSEQAVLREIDSEFNAPVMLNKKNVLETFFMSIWKDRSLGRMTPPASFPFKIEDIPGSRSITLTREYNGEHNKVVVSMSPPNDDCGPSNESDDDVDAPSNESNDVEYEVAPSNESIDHDEDDDPSNESNDEDDDALSNESNDDGDAPSNESNDEDDASSDESDDEGSMYTYPVVVNVTKKSGRSLELRCTASYDDNITIDDIHVNLPGHSSEDPKVIRDMDDTVGSEHENLKEKLKEYLKIRGLDESTISTIGSYMLNKEKHEYWLWLDNVKEFFEE